MYKKLPSAPDEPAPQLKYLPPAKPRRSLADSLTRNIALASMLLLCVVAVRSAQLPSGKTVLSAVQEMVSTEWDERLGKISFVSTLLPDAVSVFFNTAPKATLSTPCMGTLSHAWTKSEPYLGYTAQSAQVFAVAAGEVMSIAHGNDDERIVRIRHEDGLETIYYNLQSLAVAEGDSVSTSTLIGQALADAQVVIEVRRGGVAIDPTALMAERQP